MSENKYKVGGFIFTDQEDYNEAKSEAESIEYMKTTTDLTDLNKAAKLYHKLVERKTLKTVIGYTFLKELQERIIKEGILNKENLPYIQIDKEAKQSRLLSGVDHDMDKKRQDMLANYRVRLRNSRIISIFLVTIVVIMIFIAIYSDRTVFVNYENKILNKYSFWEEELSAREKAIQEKEESQLVD